jgi:hypothetical protein
MNAADFEYSDEPNWNLKPVSDDVDIGDLFEEASRPTFLLCFGSVTFEKDFREDISDFYEDLVGLLYWTAGVEPEFEFGLDQQGFHMRAKLKRHARRVTFFVEWQEWSNPERIRPSDLLSEICLSEESLLDELITFFSIIETSLLRIGLIDPTVTIGLRKAGLKRR